MMFVPEAGENMWLLLLCVLEMPQSGCHISNFHMQSCPLILFFPMYKLLNWVLDVFAQLRPFFLYLHTTWIRVAVTSSISAAQRINASTLVKHTTSLLLSNLYPRNHLYSLKNSQYTKQEVPHHKHPIHLVFHSQSRPLLLLYFSLKIFVFRRPPQISAHLYFLFLLKSLNCHKNPTPTLQILFLEKKSPSGAARFSSSPLHSWYPLKKAPLMPCFSFFFYPSLSFSCKLLLAPLFLVQWRCHPQLPP